MVSIVVSGDARAGALIDALERLFGLARREEAAFRLLIVCAYNAAAESQIAGLGSNDMLLVNADDKEARGLLARNKAPVITYGLNAKACVTASSVVEEDYKTVQCCVQRRLPTLRAARFVEEQEFSVNIVNRELGVHAVLAAVAAALVCGVPPGELSGLVV